MRNWKIYPFLDVDNDYNDNSFTYPNTYNEGIGMYDSDNDLYAVQDTTPAPTGVNATDTRNIQWHTGVNNDDSEDNK